jgi:hypothetical protein
VSIFNANFYIIDQKVKDDQKIEKESSKSTSVDKSEKVTKVEKSEKPDKAVKPCTHIASSFASSLSAMSTVSLTKAEPKANEAAPARSKSEKPSNQSAVAKFQPSASAEHNKENTRTSALSALSTFSADTQVKMKVGKSKEASVTLAVKKSALGALTVL